MKLHFDFTKTTGKIKPMHAVGQPPADICDDGIEHSMFHYLTEANIPYCRMHDTCGNYGANVFVDVPNLFRDFDADENDPASYDFAFTDALFEKMVEANAAAVGMAYDVKDLHRLKAEGRKAIMLGIENGYAIGRDIHLLERFQKKHGIVYMTLCHNGNNDICGSARPREGEQLMGVTDFGADVIREMNRLGILVDLSHGSERSFYDALDISTKPIVCSHSSCRALCDHPRNLTDDQLRALAAKGGVAQVTFYSGFLRTDGQASILDAVAHLNHMVQVMGIEHVGIGTDFDGDGGVPGLASAAELINFTRRLLREHYSEADLRLIWGGNWMRCVSEK